MCISTPSAECVTYVLKSDQQGFQDADAQDVAQRVLVIIANRIPEWELKKRQYEEAAAAPLRQFDEKRIEPNSAIGDAIKLFSDN